MGFIGKGVKLCHLVGIFVIFILCVCNIPLWDMRGMVVGAEKASNEDRNRALTVTDVTEPTLDSSEDGVVVEEAPEDDMGQELFEATSDWKTVKKGQRISPGLHVRLNLQTGEKEAKLLSESTDKQINHWDAGEQMGVINMEKQRYTREELKQALEDFKLEDSDVVNPETEDSKKKKFRSYDELKQVMKDMEMSVKTEAEILTELVNKLKEPSRNKADLETILVDMEYYLHQLDNARLFCDLDGMQLIIKFMNNSDEDIRIKALLALGSALQSNPKVQVNALEKGVLQQLLRMISVDASIPVKKKSLFALSTLLRQFPYAQRKFLEVGGLSAVTELFSKSDNEQLKVKIITLLTDLVHENDLNAASSGGDDKIQSQKAQQYSEVKMRNALHKSGWCTLLTSLLHQDSGHDHVEKIISAMTILKDTCQDQFHLLRQTLQSLSSHYKDLARIDMEQGETDYFFDTIYSSIEKLLKDIKFKREDL